MSTQLVDRHELRMPRPSRLGRKRMVLTLNEQEPATLP